MGNWVYTGYALVLDSVQGTFCTQDECDKKIVIFSENTPALSQFVLVYLPQVCRAENGPLAEMWEKVFDLRAMHPEKFSDAALQVINDFLARDMELDALDVIAVSDAERVLGLPRTALRKLCSAGVIPARLVANRYIITGAIFNDIVRMRGAKTGKFSAG